MSAKTLKRYATFSTCHYYLDVVYCNYLFPTQNLLGCCFLKYVQCVRF